MLKLVELAKLDGERIEVGLRLAVQAVLVSPHFLFRVELDRAADGASHLVDDYEFASRLSYFLWSSMPDDALLDAAKQGHLRSPGTLEEQVARMLKDPKSKALTENFAGQWLQLRNLKTIAPDKTLFPKFDEPLRAAMKRETELFFEAIVKEDRSILDFLDADFTFVNERLAKHYGIDRPCSGDEFRRVTFTDGRRGGLVTQASILTVTSNPTRTSPVKRGKWVLEQILGTPPPPPPPEVPELKDDEGGQLTGTLRQRMEQHRANPNCATCHAKMDPLGFGLENFDAIGAWRDKDGELPDRLLGRAARRQDVPGARRACGEILKGKDKEFTRCLAEKLLTFALGRGLEEPDRCVVDEIAEAVAADGHRFSPAGAGDRATATRSRSARPKGRPNHEPTPTLATDGPPGPGHGRRPALAGGHGRRPSACAAAAAPAAAADGVLLRPQRRPHAGLDARRPRAPTSSCPTILEPLAAFKDDLIVLTGLAQDNGEANGDGPGDHARAMATFLTGGHPKKTDGADIKVGMSVDQVAAEKVGKATRFPSLELGIERGAQAGNCDSGYSCAYSSNISWRSRSRRRWPRRSTRAWCSSGSSAHAGRRVRRGQGQARPLPQEHPRLRRRRREAAAGPARRDRPPQARRVPHGRPRDRAAARAASRPRPTSPPGLRRAPAGIPNDYREHVRLMGDMMVLAFQADLTRIATFMFANEGSNRRYPFIGVPEGHHDLSHHGNDPKKHEKIKKINTFHIEQFAYLARHARRRSRRATARCWTTR